MSFQASNYFFFVDVQSGLCRAWSEIQTVVFVFVFMRGLNYVHTKRGSHFT